MRPRTRAPRHGRLLDLAEAIRSRYFVEMRVRSERSGRKVVLPRDENADWLGAAAFVDRNQLPMAQWVHYVVQGQRVPRPQNLQSSRLLQRFQASALERRQEASLRARVEFDGDRERVADELDCLRAAVESGELRMTRRELLLNVVGNNGIELSPLFRYCWCVEQKLELAKDFFMPAMRQYTLCPEEYDEVMGGWIPEDFREKARRFV